MPSARADEFRRAARDWSFSGLGKQGVMSGGNTKTGVPTTIPVHGGRQIGPALFHKILEQLGIDEKRFDQLR